jgi:hypothetical protein
MLNVDPDPDLNYKSNRLFGQKFEPKERCPALPQKSTKPDVKVGTERYLMGGHDLPLAGQADVVKQFLVSQLRK